jgi:hypothetical protein
LPASSSLSSEQEVRKSNSRLEASTNNLSKPNSSSAPAAGALVLAGFFLVRKQQHPLFPLLELVFFLLLLLGGVGVVLGVVLLPAAFLLTY